MLDATGAVVPSATVTITGSETGNVLRILPSNDKGFADVPLIPPGSYDISVAASGFKTTIRQHIPVTVGSVQDVRINARNRQFYTGDHCDRRSAAVEDKSATLAQVISSRQLIDLPLDSTLARNEIIPGSLDSAVDSGTPTFNVSSYAAYGAQASCCSNSRYANPPGCGTGPTTCRSRWEHTN